MNTNYDSAGEGFGAGMIIGGLGAMLYKQYVDQNLGLELALPVMITMGIWGSRLYSRIFSSVENTTQRKRNSKLEEKTNDKR